MEQKFFEFAPFILVVVMYIYQNNIFVRPEKLEQKHREILDEVDKKLEKHKQNFVELNAYKEFQNRVLNSIDKVDKNINELKEFLMSKNKEI